MKTFTKLYFRLIGQVWNADGTFRHTTDLVRVKNGNKITYRQTYIISIKYECFDGVFCYPIVYAMARKKSKLAYAQLLKHLDEIHALFNPDSEPLIPSALSVDIEKACISAFKEHFQSKYGIDLKVRLCSFHVKQAFKRFLENEWKSVTKCQAEKRKIFKLLCACVFSPFQRNPLLRSRLYSILTDEISAAPSKARRAVANLIEFLKSNYMVLFDDQSFKAIPNWNYFDDVLSGEPDTTNNCSETINRKFNHEIRLGFKSFKKVAISIHRNKKSYIDKLHETTKKDRMRKRPVALREKIINRQDIICQFSQLEPEEQILQYKMFLLDISKQL